MHAERNHVRLTIDHGIATLWLDFPGQPVNALDLARLAEIEACLTTACRDPHIEVLVIRSDRPAGFCGGYDGETLRCLASDEEAAAFARIGQRILNHFSSVEPVTVAFLEGPCLGSGWELALACDYRLAFARPDSWIGFPNAPQIPPCWGGLARLGRSAKSFRDGQIRTAKETVRLGLIDDAFSARRAKVELQNWLDRIASRPRKRTRIAPPMGLAEERFAFREAMRLGRHRSLNRLPEELPDHATQAVERALRGDTIVTAAKEIEVRLLLEIALARGRVTPLELEQASKRIAFRTSPARGAVRLATPTQKQSTAKIAA